VKRLALLLVLLAAPAAAADMTARIIACHDGDTCTVDRDVLPGRNRVRIANIDAPELGAGAHCLAERLLADIARDFAQDLVGETVTLTEIRPDRYRNRFDAVVVTADGVDYGQAAIEQGLAVRWAGHRASWCAP
jgi:endonuclease YncB( thermonuclease family)